MALALRHDLSFCRVDDQIFFLDLKTGRYSQLHRPAAIAFARLQQGEPFEQGDEESLASLVAAGLLEDCEQPREEPEIRVGMVVIGSLQDEIAKPASAVAAGKALAGFLWTSTKLKSFGLNAALKAVRRSKAKAADAPRADREMAISIAAAFLRVDELIGRQDRCLPRSLAIVGALLRAGQTADLVFGVAGKPFNAHCWVQMGDMLVSDRVEQVRDYTPILVI